MLPSSLRSITSTFHANVLFAFTPYPFYLLGFFSVSWKQKGAVLSFIFTSKAWEISAALRQAGEIDLVAVGAQPQTGRTSAGSQLCFRHPGHAAAQARAAPTAWQGGSSLAPTTLICCVLPWSPGARGALGILGWRMPALTRNGNAHDLC